MAKYRHRTFEMYESRDEAVAALTPKVRRDKADSADPGLWAFQHFAASRADGVTLISFKASMNQELETTSSIGDELTLMSRSLANDSRVVIDFGGLPTLAPEAIESLEQFKKTLQSKGSQLALCNLEPDVHAAFFPKR